MNKTPDGIPSDSTTEAKQHNIPIVVHDAVVTTASAVAVAMRGVYVNRPCEKKLAKHLYGDTRMCKKKLAKHLYGDTRMYLKALISYLMSL